jgi:hypothetical protein
LSVYDNLPDLPPIEVSPLVGAPVAWDHLVTLLEHIKPTNRTGWRDLIAAVQNTNSGRDGARYDLLKDKIDKAYHGDLDTIWRTMPPKEGGLGYGSLLHLARDGGYTGLSAAGVKPVVLGEIYTTVAASTARPSDLIPVWDIDETLSQPPPTWLVENIVSEDENFVIYGPPKKGKSLFTLEVALSICAGIPVLDKYKVLRSGPVVYLSGEGTSFLSKRVNAWLKARKLERANVKDNWFYVPKVPPIGNPTELQSYVDAIRAKIGTTRPALIIVDTMSRALGANDENSAATMNLYEDLTREIMRVFNCSCWTIAHVGKDASRGLRGNNSAEGNFDTNSNLSEVGDARLFTRQDRGFESTPFYIAVVATPYGEVLAWSEAGKGNSNGVNRTAIHIALGHLWKGKPVLTKALAEQMVSDNPELPQINTVTQALNRGVKKLFADYVFEQGDDGGKRTWYIPESVEKEDEDFS